MSASSPDAVVVVCAPVPGSALVPTGAAAEVGGTTGFWFISFIIFGPCHAATASSSTTPPIAAIFARFRAA